MRLQRLETRQMLAAEGATTAIAQSVDVSSLDGDVNATVVWGDGRSSPATVSAAPATGPLRFIFDYSLDTSGLFDSSEAQQTLELAGRTVLQTIGDSLLPIDPNPANNVTWIADFSHPSTGQRSINESTLQARFPQANNLQVPGNAIHIFVGGRNFTGTTIGLGGFGGFFFPAVSNVTASQLVAIEQFREGVQTRGQSGVTIPDPTDTAPWGGTISFDTSNRNWHFGSTTEGLGPDETDFLSVAMHELFHVLGFGLSASWNTLADGAVFNGPKTQVAYQQLGGGDTVPIDREHFETPLIGNVGNIALMEARISPGTRQPATPLDFAGLDDIGWDVTKKTINVNANHVYGADGDYAAQIRVTGSGGVEQIIDVPIRVDNAAPTLTVPLPSSGIAGQPITGLVWTIDDPGFTVGSEAAETFAYSINWGDGSAAETGTASITRNGSSGQTTQAQINASHVYNAAGNYSVTTTVDDGDGGMDTETFVIQVEEPPDVPLQASFAEVELREDSDTAAQLTVRRPQDAVSEVANLTLTGGNGRLTYDGTVEIPIGQDSITIPISPAPNVLLQAMELIVVQISGEGFVTASAAILMIDDENLFQNTEDRFNVSGAALGDANISSLDALQVINALNDRGGAFDIVGLTYEAGSPQWDVNGDLRVSPIDALQIINFLNANPTLNSEPGPTVGASVANDDESEAVDAVFESIGQASTLF
ncbi:MAG: dockerin type I domain-containing protein [Planctomycetota bacterium]